MAIAERFGMSPEDVLDNIVCARAHNSEQQLELLQDAASLMSDSRCVVWVERKKEYICCHCCCGCRWFLGIWYRHIISCLISSHLVSLVPTHTSHCSSFLIMHIPHHITSLHFTSLPDTPSLSSTPPQRCTAPTTKVSTRRSANH